MDAYDKAVAYLRERPREIRANWLDAQRPTPDRPARILFGFVTKHRGIQSCCGCLTQIRNTPWRVAETDSLTEAIKDDGRLPTTPEKITVDLLDVFAEWQRRIDTELGRDAPEWLGPEMIHAGPNTV
jgi:hypothetical protein